VRLEKFDTFKNSVTLLGIKSATFRLVASCLNHSAVVEELNEKLGHLQHLFFPNIFSLVYYFASSGFFKALSENFGS
jgi:hypothetical protein